MKYIDLYHKEFRPHRTPAFIRIAQLACVCLVLSAIGAYIWHDSRIAELRTILLQAETTHTQLNAQLTELQQHLQAQNSDVHLQRRLDAMRQKLKLQRPVFEALQQISMRQGRSIEVLTTLAQHRLTDVWFTGIHLNNAGHYMRLEGRGTTPSQISTALDILMQQQVFAGQNFELLQIQRQEDGAYQFALGSHTNPQGEQQ